MNDWVLPELSFAAMTQETFALSQNPPSEYLENDVEEINFEFPATAGLVYRSEMSSGSFCLRGVATDSIEQLFCDLEEGESRLIRRFKLNNLEDIQSLCYFQTDCTETAEVIELHLLNRRFPFDESSLSALSDPGFNWWLNLEENSLKISFRPPNNDSQNLINLGPLGDSVMASQCFESGRDVFCKLFAAREYSVGNNGIEILVDRENKAFRKFKSLLISGQEWPKLNNTLVNLETTTLLLYFRELCLLRRFWIDATSLLPQYLS
jgi:hypothetical protein